MSSVKDPKPKFDENSRLKLKPRPRRLPPTAPLTPLDSKSVISNYSSWSLNTSAVASTEDVRAFYLKHVGSKDRNDISSSVAVPPPLISVSPFVPSTLVRVLMRRKKDSALGVKYKNGDEITDMEGAMHTFVTPLVGRCEMIGDYQYNNGHGVILFGDVSHPGGGVKYRQTRSVAMSASIQPDFETPKVMLRVCKLDDTEVIGKDLLKGSPTGDVPWENCTIQDKQDPRKRAAYDARLRAHMVFHLTSSHRLPAKKEVRDPISWKSTISVLEVIINTKEDVGDQLVDQFMRTQNGQVVSLELLYNSAVQQVINEFSALEAMYPQGYVYTYDPPSIFASEIGAPVLNRLFVAAVKAVSNHNLFANMRTFAINDYAEDNIVALSFQALAAQVDDGWPHKYRGGLTVRCVPKKEVFGGSRGKYWDEERDAMLVVHNNSDGFGQNIETEGMGGSLDGAIGATSSAAASLERNREDLLDFIF